MADTYTQSELRAEVRRLDEQIRTGINSTSTDGTSVSVDLAALTAERDRLNKQLDHYRKRRPTVAGIRLGGF